MHVTAETAKKLNDLASTSGRAPEDIVEDALAGYLEEVASVRKTLDSRYDDLKSGQVKPIDGEEAFQEAARKERAPTIGRMSGYAFHPDAVADLNEIWEYIAQHNIGAADRVLADIHTSSARRLAHRSPLTAHRTSDTGALT